MISIDDGQAEVVRRTAPLDAVRVSLFDAVGRTLAEDVASDVDSPPHNKAMVDGYALRSADLASGEATLEVIDEIVAGDVPRRRIGVGQAARIMTGAPIPQGADAVVMVEKTESMPPASQPIEPGDSIAPADASNPERSNGTGRFELRDAANGGQNAELHIGRVVVREPECRVGLNIMKRATSLARGDVVLRRGVRLRGVEIGLLAEVGRADVLAIRRPRVAVLATGNELVPPGHALSPGQIRNSNGPMLAARIRELGCDAVDLGGVRDESDAMDDAIRRGLDANVLLLSGGVSAGALDLVPSRLAAAGVVRVFHKVRLKPGKPLWFGVRPASESGAVDGDEDEDEPDGGAPRHATLVFGLPGNPVSSLVCFELFVRPTLAALQEARHGHSSNTALSNTAAPFPTAVWRQARLEQDFEHRGDRVTLHPGRLSIVQGELRVAATRWCGSADLRALTDADALIRFDAGERLYRTGEWIPVWPLS